MELMIQKVAKEVVSSVWVELPGEAIDSVLDAEPEEDDDFYDFCFCKEGLTILKFD